MSSVSRIMKELEPEYIKIRRYLHQHPELSYQEFNTTDFIKKNLPDMALKHSAMVNTPVSSVF